MYISVCACLTIVDEKNMHEYELEVGGVCMRKGISVVNKIQSQKINNKNIFTKRLLKEAEVKTPCLENLYHLQQH